MTDEKTRSMWVVSSEPATTQYGTDSSAMNSLTFKERVSIDQLKAMVKDFAKDLASVFDAVGDSQGRFVVESIEVGAVMAADGKLGILGSSFGGKAEGSIKFVLKRPEL